MSTGLKSPAGTLCARSLFHLVGLAFACAAVAPTSAQGPLEVRTESPFIVVRSGPRVVLRYRYADVPCKPYVQEWRSPAGTNVVRDAPLDHKHHHGLMFAVSVDGVNFWEEQEASGHQIHRELIDVTPLRQQGLHGVRFTQRLEWVNPRDRVVLLRERRTLEVYAGGDLGASLLTWQSQLSVPPGKTSVELTGSAYFGLGMRFPQAMDANGRFVNANGQVGVTGTNDHRAAWVAYRARNEAGPVTVAAFDHPKNERHPATWYTMEDPFAYVSNTLNLAKKPLTVRAGKPLVLRYATAVWDGHVESSRVDRLYRRWSRLPIAPTPPASADASSPGEAARRNAPQASAAFSEMQRWLHEVALPVMDSESKLFRATGDAWNYRDTAADCYPFLAWAAWFTDRKTFDGPIRDAFHAERRLCSEYGPIPVDYDFRTRRKRTDQRSNSVPTRRSRSSSSRRVEPSVVAENAALVSIAGRTGFVEIGSAFETTRQGPPTHYSSVGRATSPRSCASPPSFS